MCMTPGCSGGGSQQHSSGRNGGYTPKSKSAGNASQPALPRGWPTGGNSKSNQFGTPKIRSVSFGKK